MSIFGISVLYLLQIMNMSLAQTRCKQRFFFMQTSIHTFLSPTGSETFPLFSPKNVKVFDHFYLPVGN